MSNLKKIVRTAQTHFPFLLEAKATIQRQARAALRLPSEDTYRLFKFFPFRAGQQFVDVGANRGQTIASFRLWRDDVPIVSFEPNNRLSQRLKALYGHDKNLTIHPVGLGDSEGAFTLHVPSYRGFQFDGLASLDVDAAASWLNADSIYGFNPSLISVETRECLVRKLDDFNLDPGLVKIDVQGYEKQVLQGGAQTIGKSRPVFIIENDDDGMKHAAYLASLDYLISGYANGGFAVGKPGFRNSVFIPKEKVDAIVMAYPKS